MDAAWMYRGAPDPSKCHHDRSITDLGKDVPSIHGCIRVFVYLTERYYHDPSYLSSLPYVYTYTYTYTVSIAYNKPMLFL